MLIEGQSNWGSEVKLHWYVYNYVLLLRGLMVM